MDGSVATEYVGSQDVSVYVTHGGWCYDLDSITNNAQALAQHRSEIDAILASFRFNR